MAKHKKKNPESKNRILHFLGAVLVLSALSASGYYWLNIYTPASRINVKSNVVGNYSDEAAEAAMEFDLPYSYLMALIQLECGGQNPPGKRFERHVYRRLKDVRDGKRSEYSGITNKHISEASDEALKNLATSWGPFQLMGYQCILLDVKIKDIRGPRSVYYGAKWINLAYGTRLRKEQFMDCFHIHNTGRPYPSTGVPKTHDPKYVPRGLAYMDRFKSIENASE